MLKERTRFAEDCIEDEPGDIYLEFSGHGARPNRHTSLLGERGEP